MLEVSKVDVEELYESSLGSLFHLFPTSVCLFRFGVVCASVVCCCVAVYFISLLFKCFKIILPLLRLFQSYLCIVADLCLLLFICC